MAEPMLSPQERYQRDLAQPGFEHDPAQQEAVDHLQSLYEALLQPPERPGLWARLTGKTRVRPVRGLYFWGGVGRGKTYLMDNFYESLPFEHKLRVHFHRFMRRVHAGLKRHAGQKNPLELVADGIADEARVICFDEFFVSDITDAMILAGLLQALFDRGVTLVATSNIEPAGLYKDGLQRARFLPAIDLLEEHTRVVNVDGGVDYRLRALERAPLYHTPLDAAAGRALADAFDNLCPPGAAVYTDTQVEVENRPIRARRLADDVVWFEFAELCEGPRSQNDYIELACEFHSVIVANVPQMGRDSEDRARRFINLVDEFYDRRVKLVLSAAVALEALYSGGRLAFEFERTTSRLLQMQSHDYLAMAHKP